MAPAEVAGDESGGYGSFRQRERRSNLCMIQRLDLVAGFGESAFRELPVRGVEQAAIPLARPFRRTVNTSPRTRDGPASLPALKPARFSRFSPRDCRCRAAGMAESASEGAGRDRRRAAIILSANELEDKFEEFQNKRHFSVH